MTSHHPTSQQLSMFAAGACEPGLSLIISAHIDMCPECAAKVRQEEQRLATNLLDTQNTTEELDPQLQQMLGEILQMPQATETAVLEPTYLDLDGRKFILPRALRRYSDKISGWSKSVGKLWQAKVDLGLDCRADFIYMEKGGSVPEHTHKGSELTLVLDGEFSDGLADYDTGDFLSFDGQHTHAPRTEADEGCLVFSIVDKPFHFTSGVARLINPFSNLFFKM